MKIRVIRVIRGSKLWTGTTDFEWLPRAVLYADKPRKLAQWRDEWLEGIAAVIKCQAFFTV